VIPRFGAMVMALGLAAPAAAQSLEASWPGEPVSGASVGPRPILSVHVEGTDVELMKFRIALSRDEFKTVAHTFDQGADANGWAWMLLGDEHGAIYRVKEPLQDGLWEWKVWAWNGIEWVPGKHTARFTVDAVPPADVDGVSMRANRIKKSIDLRWSAVVTDQNGRPERVRKYKIYRWSKKAFFAPIRVFGIGETETTWFEDTDAKVLDYPILFYKIVAEDEAGNETGRRY
jgi:hypothetical protein